METFVQPFPPTGAKYQVSTGGRTPVWGPSGRDLLFASAEDRIVSVDVQTVPAFTFGKPVPLPIERAILGGPGRNFDITPDGKQLIVVRPSTESRDDSLSRQIHVTLNWFEELRQRVPPN